MNTQSHVTEHTTWAIRASRVPDLDTVRDLLGAAGLPTEGVEDAFESGFIVAEDEDRVIGSVGMETYGRYGLFRSLTVVPEWRGRGVGRALLEDRLDKASSSGLIAVFLLTVEPEYFVGYGFEPVKRDSVPPEIRNSPEFSNICPDTATVMVRPVSNADDMRRSVRETYAAIAKTVKARQEEATRETTPATDKDRNDEDSCCGPDCCGSAKNVVTSELYSTGELDELPREAAEASLGCGNPTALAELLPGETVLDLGSGGGIDVLLSARRVGPTGKAYGLDMTDDMLDIARANQKKVGVENVEFIKGEIENIPLPDKSVDVILSNCVINLSTDKRRVLSEAFRVLRPGGRFAVADVVTRGPLPEAVRRDAELWAGCLAGSLEEDEYKSLLAEVGFREIEIEETRSYAEEDFRRVTDAKVQQSAVGGKFLSAFIRAKKPLDS